MDRTTIRQQIKKLNEEAQTYKGCKHQILSAGYNLRVGVFRSAVNVRVMDQMKAVGRALREEVKKLRQEETAIIGSNSVML
jgi:hypothetical protein